MFGLSVLAQVAWGAGIVAAIAIGYQVWKWDVGSKAVEKAQLKGVQKQVEETKERKVKAYKWKKEVLEQAADKPVQGDIPPKEKIQNLFNSFR